MSKIIKAIGTVSLVTLFALFWKLAIFLTIALIMVIFTMRKIRRHNNKHKNEKWGKDKKW